MPSTKRPIISSLSKAYIDQGTPAKPFPASSNGEVFLPLSMKQDELQGKQRKIQSGMAMAGYFSSLYVQEVIITWRGKEGHKTTTIGLKFRHFFFYLKTKCVFMYFVTYIHNRI